MYLNTVLQAARPLKFPRVNLNRYFMQGDKDKVVALDLLESGFSRVSSFETVYLRGSRADKRIHQFDRFYFL